MQLCHNLPISRYEYGTSTVRVPYEYAAGCFFVRFRFTQCNNSTVCCRLPALPHYDLLLLACRPCPGPAARSCSDVRV